VAYTRQEVTARRAEWDTAHGALLTAAGPQGVITGTDVDQVRLTADALDTYALTERWETVRTLEGALVRAENRAAHQHARSELALPAAAAAAAAISAVATDTATRPSRTTTADAPHTAVLPDATPAARTATAAPAEPGWRRLLGPRPTDPARAAQWEQTVAAVTTYRATYNVTSTNPLTPLGSAPTPGSDQAPVYRAITKQWRSMTMTSSDSNPGVGESPSAVTARLAEVERRLVHLREQRELRRDRLEDTVESQDGITDDQHYGHDTGHNAIEQNRRSGMGY